MKMKTLAILILFLSSSSVLAQKFPDPTLLPNDKKEKVDEVIHDTTSGAIQKAKVYFVEPKDGATVAKTFKIKMGVEGMKIRPAGEAPDEMISGHHHVIINKGAISAGQPIATDDKHLHFGKGQTETEVTLPPGKHTLTLQFADGAHRSFGPKMSQTITVIVK
ncbi:MAG: DUF4399 domain-containing protein [Pseudobdellovibrionaceae bacterium]